jgi:predicted phage-related endonuclease
MALPGNLPTAAIPLLPPLRSRRSRERWLDARRQYVCASDIAAILDVPGAYRSAFAVWWGKKAGWSTDQLSEEAEWGLRLEPAMARRFAEAHPELRVIRPPASLWRHPDHTFAACTPDRFALTSRPANAAPAWDLRPVELKSDQNGRRWGEQPPEVYRVQLAWQALVLGVRAGYLAVLVGRRYREYFLEFGQAELEAMLDPAREFHESLRRGDPPDVDGHPSTTEALETVYADFDPDYRTVVDADLADRYERAYTEAAAAKALLRATENELRAAMGMAGQAMTPTGRLIARRLRYKRAGYSVAPGEVDQLRHEAARGAD